VFVSYSRVDFAFAEAVVDALRRHERLDPWLDLQRLRPGDDWEAALDKGLDEADALVLVASPSALASNYVRRELARARDRHLPVYVAVVAAVRLDDDLTERPGLDLRIRFRRRAAELGRVVAGDATAPSPRTTRWRMPVPVAVLVALAIVTTSALAAACLPVLRLLDRIPATLDTPVGVLDAEAVRAVVLVYPVLAAAAAVPVVVSTAGLLVRRSTLRSLGMSLTGPVLFGAGALVFGTPIAPVLPVAMLVAAAVSAIVFLSSTAVRLRLPSGHDLDIDRFVTGMLAWLMTSTRADDVTPTFPLSPKFAAHWEPYRRRLAALADDGSARTVAVRAEEIDEQVAAIVTGACVDAGLTVTTGPAQWTLVLVSAYTDLAALDGQVKNEHTRVIFVLVDSFRAGRSEKFRQYQWLDFRGRAPEHLFSLLSALRDRPAAGHPYLSPIAPERFRAPIGVHAFVNGTRDFVGSFGGAAAGLLVTSPLSTASLLQGVLSVLVLGGVVAVHDRTTKRRITRRGLGLSTVAVGVVACAWAVTWLSVHGADTRLWPTAIPVVGLVVIVLGLPVYLAVMTWYLGEAWLPVRAPVRGGRTSVGAGLFAVHTPLLVGAGYGAGVTVSLLTGA
jgi:hypothetical protein